MKKWRLLLIWSPCALCQSPLCWMKTQKHKYNHYTPLLHIMSDTVKKFYPRRKTNFSTYKSRKWNQASWKYESRSSVISANTWGLFAVASRAALDPLTPDLSCDLCGVSTSRFISLPPFKTLWLSMKYWLGWLSEKLASSVCSGKKREKKQESSVTFLSAKASLARFYQFIKK